MSLRVILYRLQSDKNGKTILDCSLNSEEILISNTLENVIIRLDEKLYTIPKAVYMNKRIWDNGKTFFYMVDPKRVNEDYVFNLLLDYAEAKIDTRISHLQIVKEQFKKERKQLKAA